MTVRLATCTCGQLRVSCRGEPIRVSMCHCLACQRRTGSVFGVQARYAREQVAVEGRASVYLRTADSGYAVREHFCPGCGSTVYWQLDRVPAVYGVAVGAFADPGFAPPRHSFCEASRHRWTRQPDAEGMEHGD